MLSKWPGLHHASPSREVSVNAQKPAFQTMQSNQVSFHLFLVQQEAKQEPDTKLWIRVVEPHCSKSLLEFYRILQLIKPFQVNALVPLLSLVG